MNRFPLLAPVLAVAMLAGCASVVVPPSQVPSHSPALAAVADTGLALGTPPREWWRALGDPQLDALVAEATGHNRELRAALAAVDAARSLAEAAARDALPQGRLDAQAQLRRPSTADTDPYRQGLPRPPSSRLVTVGQGLSWEIDLFGRVGTAEAVAGRRADGAAADWHAAMALVQAEVVRHYTGLRHQQQALSLLADEAAAHAIRAKQLSVRVAAGLADQREVLAVDVELARLRADSVQARAAQHTHLAALALLAGRSPAEGDAWRSVLLAPGSLPSVPDNDAIVQPTDLLARRPDVVRADAQLRVALGETVLAERAHLPRVSLNVAFGLNAPFGRLGDAGALRHAVGPALSWEWLDAGRSDARAAAARAGQEAALQAFEHTVLRALHDSEIALRQWAAASSALADARRAEALARRASAHARSRVDAGLEPPVNAHDAAATHLRAQRAALAVQADALRAFGHAQLALGAWQPQPQQQPDRVALHR